MSNYKIPVYYRDGVELILFTEIYSRDKYTYGRALEDQGFVLYYFKGAYFIFKKKEFKVITRKNS